MPRNIRQAVEARLKDYAAQAQTVPARRRAFRRATWQKRLPPSARKTG